MELARSRRLDGLQAFPHPYDDGSHATDNAFYERWQESPASDAYIEELSEVAIDSLMLGRGPATDYLALSLSTLDLVGHDFGPESHEVQDVLSYLDVTLGRLFTFLDNRLGRGEYVVALSADHGVAPIPEQATKAGLDAGRISTATISQSVEKALEPVLGPGPHVGRVIATDVYFEPQRSAAILGNAAAMKAIRDALLAVPGLQHVFSRAEISRPREGSVAAGHQAELRSRSQRGYRCRAETRLGVQHVLSEFPLSITEPPTRTTGASRSS